MVTHVRPGTVHEIGVSSYHVYVPDSHTDQSRVIVVVHGEPGEDDDVVELARTFLDRWIQFAEATGAVIVAPAFNRIDFGSDGDGFGGYRGLYGRVLGADEFLHQVLDQVGVVTPVPTAGRRFLLYGHSAGGQFAGRYVVRHPERVIAAVLSAPGRYAFPDPSVAWPYGMSRSRRKIEWELDGEPQLVDVRPDPDGWVKAAALPITVVVGDEDVAPQPCRPAHCDPSWGETATRIQIGRRWVEQMNTLADDDEREGRVGFRLVEGPGHNSAQLTHACQDALVPALTPTVPSVVGTSERRAVDTLEEAGLRSRIGNRRLSDRPKGEVVWQTPDAGSVVRRDHVMILHVSLGEREEEMGRVPNVRGETEHDATAMLRGDGFVARPTHVHHDSQPGLVVRQRPGAGEAAPPDSDVQIWVSLGPGQIL